MIGPISWEERMSRRSTKDRSDSPTVFDKDAKDLFEFLLPELARSAEEYLPAGPDAVRMRSGDGHTFLWMIRSKSTSDPFATDWALCCYSSTYLSKKQMEQG